MLRSPQKSDLTCMKPGGGILLDGMSLVTFVGLLQAVQNQPTTKPGWPQMLRSGRPSEERSGKVDRQTQCCEQRRDNGRSWNSTPIASESSTIIEMVEA